MTKLEIRHVSATAGPRVLSLNARKIPGDGERAELILLGLEDVTEREARGEALREGARRKDEFLAMLAHELRNPLAPITHAVQLLRHSHADPASVKLYEMIGRQTLRLVRLVDELLDVARISRGLIAIKRQAVDLVVIVRQAVEASRLRIEEAHHALSLVLPDEPVPVDGDAVRLEQVVCNLLENAAKYTKPGGRIALTLGQEEGQAVLSVRDSGIGLARDTLETIFDLFVQMDSSVSHSGGGLGLGLAVVRRILELHGGRIEARSAGLGTGSEFIARLPVVSATIVTTPLSHGPEALTAGSARRILIVDDNADSAHSMALLARSWGHEVVTARDGREALELAEGFRPDMALVDIGLPDMDGYELARRFRKAPLHGGMQLVAMTGYGRREDREAALTSGFAVHLVKPAKIEELHWLLANGPAASST